MTNKLNRWIGALAGSSCLLAGLCASPSVLAADIKAELIVGNAGLFKEYILTKREKEVLFYRLPDAPAGVMASMNANQVKEAKFNFKVDETAVFNALNQRQWDVAGVLLARAITAALPYVDLPENDVAEPALQAGGALIRAARSARASNDTAKAETYFKQANIILSAVSGAKWFPASDTARLRNVEGLLGMGKIDEAAKALDNARVPEAGDGSYGLYWLAKAEIAHARGDLQEAMSSVLKSVVFETKDIDVFPDALFFMAQCHEDLMELHRARDLYYELARLFPGTDWGDQSTARLKRMMEGQMTSAKESVAVTDVFFGSTEDVNAKVEKFLKSLEKVEPKKEGTK